ncbi:hypothetical protein EBT31_04570 [bacterium]|nr:hypothetical protein [bacterium]NBX50089.1 hypothetical protein [bacterium]
MRGKDLAGLAALGTLGYMLANKKKDADVDTSKISDMDLTGGARSPAMPMGDMKDTEFGDLAGAQDAAQSRAVMDQFNANERLRTPSKSSLKTVKNAVRSGAMDTAGFEGIGSSTSKKGGFDNGIAREAERMQNLRSEFGKKRSSTDDSPSFQDRMAREYLDKKKAGDRQAAMERGNLKGGGKVIKMAKGGMTRSSASSRGDGIATKGRTKGRIL